MKLAVDDVLVIKKAEVWHIYSAMMQMYFIQPLRTKLHWSGGPRA